MVIKAFSKQLQQQQLHQKPVCTFQSIPTGERDEAMLQKEEEEGEEEENGRK